MDRLIRKQDLNFSDRLARDLRQLIRDVDQKTYHGDVVVRPKINAWLERKKKDPEHLRVRSFHAFSRTTPPEDAQSDDFNEDSAEQLLRDIRRELLGTQT